MISRGIVERLVDAYTCKVRIPTLDRVQASSVHTPTDELMDAKICTLANCDPNIQVGDIVFVAFEDNDYSKPVIIGYLYSVNKSPTRMSITFDELTAETSANLPSSTNIGEVTYLQLQQLVGLKSNLQQQLDYITDAINKINSNLGLDIV